MVENRSTPTSYCQTSFLVTQQRECLLWQSGHLEKCCIMNHPHTDAVLPATQKPFNADFNIFYPHFSMTRPKSGGCREVCGMDTKLPGNHQSGQGVTAQNWEDFQSVSYQLPVLWWWSQPWCVLEKILNSWNSLLGKVMNSPLDAFSFKTGVPSKYLINKSISFYFI